ncbi:sulfate transporter CysZ [uncultured Thiodictyon sp.]|uniref:sulfate transporter CysZ n=1 Tax=uncultured Thiodictyon sp. TaxID=1846217 RepID=UPI0025E314E2|nr:sulfate transporter CysZ [uncultured Thiodictyon sp.]
MSVDPVSGAGYLLQGIRLIARPGLRRFVILPLLINILVFAAGIWAGVSWFKGFVTSMHAWIPGWLQWLDWLLWPLFALLLLVLVVYGFSLVANLIASPFNGLLAEKVELLLTGRSLEQGGGMAQLLRELLPTLVDEGKKVLYALALAIPFLFLLFVPVVGPVLWFLYTAWVLALQYLDYPMGNSGLKFREMRRRLQERRGLSLGFGAATAGLSLIPVVNFIVMPSAVAGATALWVRELKGPGNYQGPHESRVATRGVRLVVDQLSGQIRGELLAGPYQGQALEAVSTEDLKSLLELWNQTDLASAEALEVYLEHERQHQVRHPHPPRPSANPPVPPSVRMVAEEARAVLGLTAQAGPEEVLAAHRRLMLRLHPDRGGSDYLAAKLNEAKDVLLG